MEDKMKILMTTDTIGGVWTYSADLCEYLGKNGVEVHLAAMGSWPSEEQEQQIQKLENVTLYKSDYKLEWMQDPWEDVERAHKWLNCIHHTIQPDLIHFNNYAHMGNNWTCPTLTVFHSCVQTWWQAVKGNEAPSEWSKYKEVVKESLNSSDLVVSPTRAILKQAIETHEIKAPTKVIYNGRKLTASDQKEKEKIILCAGRLWDEAKNLQLLSRLAGEFPWPVYVAGENDHPDTGEPQEIENVRFLGNLSQDEMDDWMQRAAIFISPSKYEPFGLAVLEAAAAGCGLVLSDLETLREIWGDAAAYFDPEDDEAAKANILQLTEDENRREHLSAKAKERSGEYTAEKMGRNYLELYRELLSPKKEQDTRTLSMSL